MKSWAARESDSGTGRFNLNASVDGVAGDGMDGLGGFEGSGRLIYVYCLFNLF